MIFFSIYPFFLPDCESEVDAGPCKARIRRWYFDKASGTCKQFFYGGCQGNNNNYGNERECKANCVRPPGMLRFVICT